MGYVCPKHRGRINPDYGSCALLHAPAPGAPGDTVAEAAARVRAIHPEPHPEDAPKGPASSSCDEDHTSEALTPSTFPGRVVPTIPGQLPLFD